MNGNKQLRYVFFPVLYLLFILFITLVTRAPSLVGSVRIIPFWSYLKRKYWKQALLNIVLFIPMGYFLSALFKKRWACLLAAVISLMIEVLQYVTCRGLFDLDDMINNMIGACIGILIWRIAGQRKCVFLIMLCAGFAGCVAAAWPQAEKDLAVSFTK